MAGPPQIASFVLPGSGLSIDMIVGVVLIVFSLLTVTKTYLSGQVVKQLQFIEHIYAGLKVFVQ